MPVCILLRGIHYDSNYCNKNFPKYIGQDFRKMKSNFYDKVYNPLKNIYGEVDIITSTYDSKLYNEMINTFNPINEIKLPFSKFRNRLIYDGLKSIINPLKYDFILIYRFDIEMKTSITNLKIDYSKINIPFKDLENKKGLWHKHHRICDAFFIIPSFLLKPVIKTFKDKYDHPKTHQYTYEYLCAHLGNGYKDIHFIIDEELYCNNDIESNPIYKNRL